MATSSRNLEASGWSRLPLVRNRNLISEMIRREVASRYRGATLGILWSLLTPLLMLVVFTFVFSTIFKARWTPPDGAATAAETSTSEFALILYVGMMVFQVFAEVVNRAPSLIVNNVNYVKKILFPLEILPVVAMGSALFQLALGLVALIPFLLVVRGSIPLTALWLPVVLAPYCLMILGLAWLLASLGVFFRDISQVLGTLVMALMFVSPVFFPLSALPEWIRPWIDYNPIVWPLEQARGVLIWGQSPEIAGIVSYTAVALLIAVIGYLWFQKTRNGFSDVL